MEDDLLSLVPFKLVLIVISHDLKNIKKGLIPTITSLQRNNKDTTFKNKIEKPQGV